MKTDGKCHRGKTAIEHDLTAPEEGRCTTERLDVVRSPKQWHCAARVSSGAVREEAVRKGWRHDSDRARAHGIGGRRVQRGCVEDEVALFCTQLCRCDLW